MRQATKLMMADLTKGLNLEVWAGLLQRGESPNVRNFDYYRKGLKVTSSFDLYSSQTFDNEWALGLIPYHKTDGTELLILITDAGWYKWVPVTDTFDLIQSWSSSKERTLSYCILLDDLLVTDGNNFIKKYSGGNSVSDLGNLPTLQITGKYLYAYATHALLLHTTESGTICPSRVRWSDTGDWEEWQEGNAMFVDLVDTPDEIKGCAELFGRLYIYKDKSIWECTYVGYPNIFHFNPIIRGIGLKAPQTLQTLEFGHIFLGETNVYMFTGRDITPIGNQIKPLLFGPQAITSPSLLAKTKSFYLRELEEYWLLVPTIVEDLKTLILKYHIPTNSWWYRDIPFGKEIRSVSVWFEDKSARWCDVEGIWDAQEWFWTQDNKTYSPINPLLIYDGSGVGRVYRSSQKTSESTIDAIWETPDLMGPARYVEFRVEVEFGGPGTLTFEYSTDEGETWTQIRQVTFTRKTEGWVEVRGFCNFTAVRVRFRVRMRMRSSLDFAYLRKVEVYGYPKVRLEKEV